ncbi:MAG: radical SAM protein [Elusimicrobiota bacterium]
MPRELDILLVNVGGTKRQVYQDLSMEFSAIDPPFWAALTAGYLRKHGFSVDILDANVRNLGQEESAEEILKAGARLTAIVVYSQQANTCTPIMTAVGLLCRKLKQRCPDIRLILTGWHPSALPERTLREESCDMVAQGEGFYTLRALLEGKPLEKVPGLWWKEGQDIRHTPRPKPVQDLTGELDEVAWDLLPIGSGQYRGFNWMCLQSLETRDRCASMLTSLGCPFKCRFCAIHATFGERRVRYWSPEWTLQQMETLAKRYGVRHINLNDELFVFNKEHYLPIAEGLIRLGLDLNICAFARVDRVDAMDASELRTLKKAGFNWFKFGIESANARILKLSNKGSYDKEVIRRVVAKVHDAGIDLCANFVFGLPGDDWETMQETLNLAFELNCSFPSFFCAMALPGADLYEESERKGVLPPTWLGYASQGYHFQPLPTEHLSSADVVRFRDYAFDAYFKNPRLLAKIEARFGRTARGHIEAMTRHRLKRKLLGD